jgi:hypothetical protein
VTFTFKMIVATALRLRAPHLPVPSSGMATSDEIETQLIRETNAVT